MQMVRINPSWFRVLATGDVTSVIPSAESLLVTLFCVSVEVARRSKHASYTTFSVE